MGKTIIKYIPIIILFISAISCTNECLDNKNSIGLAGMYSMDSKKSISLSKVSVYGIGAPNDSVLNDGSVAFTQIYLPMRINKEEVSFVFHYEQKDISDPMFNDTLTMKYESIPYFASEECGAMYWYEIKDFSYTKHIFDSVAIPTMLITNADTETIQIYLRTTKEPETDK